MFELIPIVIPNIDWKQFLTSANQILGESISTSFDIAKIPLSPKAFIVALNDLRNYESSLDLDVPVLQHLHYSFLAVMLEGTYLQFLEETKLDFTSSTTQRPGLRLAVVSGTLEQWKESVVITSNSVNPDLKVFSQKAKTFFDNLGLGDIWKHYLRVKLPDQSTKLVHRP